jgi:hypothetical protein
MIPIEYDIVDNAIFLFKNKIENQRVNALAELKKLKRRKPNEKAYLTQVITLFEQQDIVTCKPDELNQFVNSIGKAPEGRLSKRIQECLGYSSLRKTFYPYFFQKIGIKSCVYCNSQLAVVTINKKGIVSARFELDHYINKNNYPFLSISIYNLYPACSHCNKLKPQKGIKFDLYKEKFSTSEYRFELVAGCVADYLTNNNDIEKIRIRFNEPNLAPINKSFKEKFGIEEIYNTQKDLVEEMIVKNQIYNESYIETLKNNFETLFQNSELFDRIIYGNYMEEKDIHKRPMAKFMQDITKELKAMKKE